MFAALSKHAAPWWCFVHRPRRRPPARRTRLTFEQLETRLCPASHTIVVNSLSPVDLFPGVTLRKGETVHIQVSVDSSDAQEGTETEPEGVVINSSTGGLDEFVNMFGQANISYKVRQKGEVITGVSVDSDDIGTVVAERGAGLIFVNVPQTAIAGQDLTPKGGIANGDSHRASGGSVILPIAPPPGPARGFALGQQTANGSAFVQGKPAIQVKVLNNNGDLDTSFNGFVTVLVAGETVEAQAQNGVATFPKLAVDAPRLNLALGATAPNHDNGFSDPIKVLDPQFSYTVSQPEPRLNSVLIFVHDHVTFRLGGTWDPTGGPIHVTLSGHDGKKIVVQDVPPPAAGQTATVTAIFPDWADANGAGLLMAYQGDVNNPDVGILYLVGGAVDHKALFADGVSVLQGRKVHSGDFLFQGETHDDRDDFGFTITPSGALVVIPFQFLEPGIVPPEPGLFPVGIADHAAGITEGGNGVEGPEMGAGGRFEIAAAGGHSSGSLKVPLPPGFNVFQLEPSGPNVSVIQGDKNGDVNISSDSIDQQSLTVNGSLTLHNAVLFVNGNLIVKGKISGTGLIVTNGSIVQGGGTVSLAPISEAVFVAAGDILLGGKFHTFL